MLTDLALRRTTPRAKDYKLADSKGLYLLVRANGARLWRYDYRFEGKRKTMALGAYPEVGLQTARDKHHNARTEVSGGVDPMQERKRSAVLPNSFEDVGRRWLAARKARWSQKYYDEVISRLEVNAFPRFGKMPINAIEPPELLRHIRAIEDRGVVYTAKRIKNHAGEIFRFGIAEGLCVRDPSADIRGALQSSPPVQHRPSVTEQQLPEFLRALDNYGFEQDTYDAMLLTLLTACRTTETRFAVADEFEGLDGDEPIWRISPERMKMSRAHLIPLSRQAAEVVKRRLLIHPEGLLFARRTVSGSISENTMLYAMYRLGFHGRATVHGLRGTFSTIAHENNWESDWIEMALAHVDDNKVKSAYNAAKYLKQRRQLLQWWADYLDAKRVQNEKPASG